MKKSIFLILSLCLLLVSSSLADSLTSQVDSLFSKYGKSDSPGCAVALIKDGTVIYKQGYGMANLEYNVPITPSTIFHVASVSKQFTAFAILLLESDGKLSINDDIRKYLPDMPDFGKVITIRHLMNHTSGLRDQWDLAVAAGWRMDDVITQEQLLKLIMHQKDLNFAPGEEHLYCNSGYTLLAEIVTRVSGKPFVDFTQERIFKPLGMNDTHFHIDHEQIVKNRAYSYSDEGNGTYKISALNYANVGATSLFTTVEDMAKWNNNFDQYTVGGKPVVDKMQVKGVLNNGKEINYACGLVIDTYKGLRTVSHNGGDAGFRSQFKRFPDQHFSMVILSNHGSFDFSIPDKIADLYLSDAIKAVTTEKEAKEVKPATETEKPKQRNEISLDPAKLDSLVGDFELFPGFILTVSKEGNQLKCQATGQSKELLFPESEIEFFYKIVDAQISFKRDDKGVVNELVLHQNGQNLTGKRIEKFNPSLEELKQFVGMYYSDELQTFYTISLNKDNQLICSHQRHPDSLLILSKKDQMIANSSSHPIPMNFTRNEKSDITGLTIDTGRNRNLRFNKVEMIKK